MLSALGAGPAPATEKVSGSLLVLGIDLAHHAHFARMQACALLDEKRFVRIPAAWGRRIAAHRDDGGMFDRRVIPLLVPVLLASAALAQDSRPRPASADEIASAVIRDQKVKPLVAPQNRAQPLRADERPQVDRPRRRQVARGLPAEAANREIRHALERLVHRPLEMGLEPVEPGSGVFRIDPERAQ